MNGEEQFENFLREFEPRKPRALPAVPPASQGWRRIAAVLLFTVSCGASAWLLWRARLDRQPRQAQTALGIAADAEPRTLFQWTRLSQQDTRALDRELAAASQRSLPGFARKDSALRSLAKP